MYSVGVRFMSSIKYLYVRGTAGEHEGRRRAKEKSYQGVTCGRIHIKCIYNVALDVTFVRAAASLLSGTEFGEPKVM